MKLINITRGWAVDPKRCCSYHKAVLSVLGIPILTVKRTSYRVAYLFGFLPIYKEKLRKQSPDEAIMHRLGAMINVSEMPKASGVLRTFQLAELELLKKVDKVCKKHDIKYWLDFGTLLGAVRHKGFIPWDDDVDISMMREDYDKFLSVFKTEFPAELYSYNSMGFLQIHLNGTMLQVDIFPHDQAADSWFPEGKTEDDFNRKLYQVTNKLKFEVNLHEDQDDCIVNYNYAQRRELNQTEVLQGREPSPGGNIYLAIDIAATKRHTFMHDWIFPLKSTMYEGSSFPCPNNPDIILFSNYGDWGEVPRNPYHHFNLNNLTKRDYLKLLEVAKNGLS